MMASGKAKCIIFLAVFQALSSTYLLRIESLLAMNSLMFLLSGVLVSWLLVGLPVLTVKRKNLFPNSRSTAIKLMMLLIVVCGSYYFGRRILSDGPIRIENADMLPIINVMGQRFLSGDWHTVYQPIPEIWGGVQPIYLPVLWMSFLPAVLLHFDLRWIAIAGICLSALLCILPLQLKKGMPNFYSAILLAALGVLAVWLFSDRTNNVIRLTEEGVIFFYYCLLVYALMSGNAWLIGIAATLCLLSRFALAGWLPCLAIYWMATKNYGQLAKAFAAGLSAVLLLLIIPFGWKPIELFFSLPAKYVAHAQTVWTTYPDHFNKSLGMAKFFGKDGVATLHTCLLVVSFLAPLLFTVILIKKKQTNNLLLASLNLTLTLFYSFLDVSYLYLYYTPVFLTLLIAGFSLNVQSADGLANEKRSISSR